MSADERQRAEIHKRAVEELQGLTDALLIERVLGPDHPSQGLFAERHRTEILRRLELNRMRQSGPVCPKCKVEDALSFHGNCTVSCRACKEIFTPEILSDFAQFFPLLHAPVDVQELAQRIFNAGLLTAKPRLTVTDIAIILNSALGADTKEGANGTR